MNSYAQTVRVGVAGATGYTGVELIRLLSRHSAVRVTAAMGAPGAAPRYVPSLKRVWDEPVNGLDLDALADASDAVFLALPDHAAAEIAPPLVARGKRVFDLSGAFRLRDAEQRRRWYPKTPEAAAPTAVYGLTEHYRDSLRDSTLVACAGCYPTAAILALQPLLQAGALDLAAPIIIDAKSGVSGAGKTPTERTHFSECHDSLSAYGVFDHRHAAEIEQELGTAVTFVPHLLPIDRGILETIYARLVPGADEATVGAALNAAYAASPFVRLTGRDLPEIKHVAHTNFCDIGWRVHPPTRQLVLISCIDNLVKGAAGQAVQNFNVAFGFDEGLGLNPITILKLGGELLEDAAAMQRAAAGIAEMAAAGPLGIVHGGGRAIDADLKARGKEPRFVDGLRVTDGDTLETVVAVLAGKINTAFVAALIAKGVKAVGLTGADASIGISTLAPPLTTTMGTVADLGLVGVPRADAPARLLNDLIGLGYVPVIASVGVSADGSLLNVNADTLAAHLARACGAERLIVAGKTAGVFDEAGATCPRLDADAARRMVDAGTARDGMVAKLVACLQAIDGGVKVVRIVDGRAGGYETAPGTTIVGSTDREYTRC